MSTDRKFMDKVMHELTCLLDDDENEGLVAKGSAAETSIKNVIHKLGKYLADEEAVLRLENLPYDPDVMLVDPASWDTGDLTGVDIPLGYARRVASWRMLIDCEGDLVALVPDIKAEAWRKLLNALGEV